MRSIPETHHTRRGKNPVSNDPAAFPMAGRYVAGLLCALFLASIGGSDPARAGSPVPSDFDGNLVSNPALRGNFGTTTGTGTVNGYVPTLWRAYSWNGAVVNLERISLAANVVFPGSPPTQALKISVPDFGSGENNQGIDSILGFFSIHPGIDYGAQVYVRTGNADNSAQAFDMALLTYDTTPAYSGHLVTRVGSGNTAWAHFATPDLTGVAGDLFGKMSVRLIDDGGENSIIIALPRVDGPPVYNTAPNPGFAGDGGFVEGAMVSGTIPDQWRAFAVGSGSLNVTTVPLPADELFPGSPPTNAVRLEVTGGDGASEGFDHEAVRAALRSDYFYHAEMYVRSGNAGGAAQGVSVSMPIFDAGGSFTGRQPGSFFTSVGPQWTFLASPQFRASTGETTDMAFRLAADGGDDIILIAAPRIADPSGWMIFIDGFD